MSESQGSVTDEDGVTTKVNDPPVFHAVPAEYAALRSHSAVADLSDRSRGTFAGAKAAEVLTGLVTNDILALAPGQGSYAAALTPKGKIIADLRIFALEAHLLVDLAPRAAAGFWAMVRKFVNPRLARFADVSATTCELVVLGPKGADTLRRALGTAMHDEISVATYANRTFDSPHGMITLARIPDYGVEAYSLFAAADARETLLASLLEAGGRQVGAAALATARMEAGRPEWGIEIDESTIPQEANFDELQAISYTKGCYTGQETVARVHFRGHVNKHLRGLRFDSAATVPPKASLVDAEGKAVGDVRSVAYSPRLGGIALAMVRREIGVESEVMARTADGEVSMRVVALPFPHG